MTVKDERLALCTQILNGIKVSSVETFSTISNLHKLHEEWQLSLSAFYKTVLLTVLNNLDYLQCIALTVLRQIKAFKLSYSIYRFLSCMLGRRPLRVRPRTSARGSWATLRRCP